jgi:hypothetical protein
MTDGIPLKIKPEPGEYRCTLVVPGTDGTLLRLPGDLDLRGGQPPRAAAYGDVPISWDYTSGSKSAGFPQNKTFDVIRGKLLQGQDVLLIDVQMSIWAPERAHLFPRVALVGMGIADHDVLLFDSIKIQITGSDAVAGIGPLKSFTFPASNEDHLSGSWTVEGESASSQEWSDGDASLKLQYDGSLSLGDPYFYRMAFSPVVVIEFSAPVTFDECLRRWVEPVQRVMSLATGRREKITYLSMSPLGGDAPSHQRRLQVYGSGIGQDPFASRNSDVLRVSPAFRIKPDGLSLLNLVREWQRLSDEHHPMLETYGSSVVTSEQHPRSRFLLLIQALEGLHGYETRLDFARRAERHEKSRHLVLAAVKHSLYSEAQKFMKRYLMKRPPASLTTCLRDLFMALPIDLTPALEETALVKLLRSDERKPQGAFDALRLIRNDLSHGTRGYDAFDVDEVANLLDRVARAHLLRILGCELTALDRVLQSR